MDRVAAHGDGPVLVVPQRRAGVEVPRESIRPDAQIDLTLPDLASWSMRCRSLTAAAGKAALRRRANSAPLRHDLPASGE